MGNRSIPFLFPQVNLFHQRIFWQALSSVRGLLASGSWYCALCAVRATSSLTSSLACARHDEGAKKKKTLRGELGAPPHGFPRFSPRGGQVLLGQCGTVLPCSHGGNDADDRSTCRWNQWRGSWRGSLIHVAAPRERGVPVLVRGLPGFVDSN